MSLRFVQPLLHELDVVEADTLACVVWEDAGPMTGLAGLCDWRLGGRLSRLRVDGFLSGSEDECLLVSGRHAFSFEKLLLVGGGRLDGFDPSRFDRILGSILKSLVGLGARSVVAELPGRHANLMSAERAADRLLGALADPWGRQSSWTLVEDAEARRRIEQHTVEERRRFRRAP